MVSISKNTELKAQINVYKYSEFFFFLAVLSSIAATGCPGGCMLRQQSFCAQYNNKKTPCTIIQLACSLTHTASVTSLQVLINK